MEIQLILTTPYYPFLSNLTFPIVENLVSSKTNYCGAYFIAKIDKTSFGQELLLVKNPYYKLTTPIFDRIILKIYQNEQDLIRHFNQGKISLIINEYNRNLKHLKYSRVIPVKNSSVYMLIFNLESPKFKDKSTRHYLNKLINKAKILDQVFLNYGNISDAPLNNEFYNIKSAKNLASNDLKLQNINIPKNIKLSYPNNFIFSQIAEIIKSDFEKNGIQVHLEPITIKEGLIEVFKNKDYELILIGHNYTYPPDPYSFWSSTQIKFPGQNLANLNSAEIDGILEKIRTTNETGLLQDLIQKFNLLMQNDLPAIFIVNADYVVITDKRINFPSGLRANYLEDIINLFL